MSRGDELRGRTALVTAASRNLGPAIAEALAARGADVALNYLTSEEAALGLAETLQRRHDIRCLPVRGDVGAEGETVVETVLEWASRLDILVSNAGPFSKAPFIDLPEEEWDRVWDVNVKAIYRCVRAAAPSMRRHGWGRIVNVSAVSAYVRNRSIYGLAKSSVETLTEQLAVELGPEINVNAVAPGQIEESLVEMAGIDPVWAEEVVRRTPLRRLVTRGEVAQMVAMLCSSTFDGVTGVTIAIDGGLRLSPA